MIFRLARSRLKTNGILDVNDVKQGIEQLRQVTIASRKEIMSTVSKEASTSRIQNAHFHKQACGEREQMQSQLASQSKQIADMKEQQQLEMLRRKEEEIRQHQLLEKIYLSTSKKDQGGRVTTSEVELDDVKAGDLFGSKSSNVITVDASSGDEDVSLLDQPTASTSALTSQSGHPSQHAISAASYDTPSKNSKMSVRPEPDINYRSNETPSRTKTSRTSFSLHDSRTSYLPKPTPVKSLNDLLPPKPKSSRKKKPGNNYMDLEPNAENIRPSEMNARKQHLRNVAKGIENKAQAIANDGLDDGAKLNLVPLGGNSYPTSKPLRRSKRRLAQGGR